jgi:hypothetical protein
LSGCVVAGIDVIVDAVSVDVDVLHGFLLLVVGFCLYLMVII